MTENSKIALALVLMAVTLIVLVKGILVPMFIADTNHSCGEPPKAEAFATSAEYQSCNTQYVPTPEEQAAGQYNK